MLVQMRPKILIKRYSSFYLLLLLTVFQSDAQDLIYQGKPKSFNYSQRDFILELSPTYVYREDAFPRIAGSVNMQYFVTRNVSINGNISLGQDYAHFGPAILGIPLMVLGIFQPWFAADDLIMVGIIMFSSFESTSFHFPVGKNLDISPYFSLLRFQYLYEPPESKFNDFSISLALGSRLNIFLSDHWIIAPYLEYTRTYGSRLDGLQGGIYMGYYFRSRISVETE